ncbi:hypothetical protein HAZT_HAZT009375 [Hyalella azteca]|uniref:Uncharacterized protein n=1 Tax=Hyalella azteca TaxID=294128 RepID=A0A6A0HE85_HYAAZ|nr:hypothetical protein HAZT_HAZT009375 [Hyalella azteca]
MGRVVDRARAWCSALHVPFVRLNPQLSADIALDESSDKKLLRIMWEARAEMRRNTKIVNHLKYLLIPPGEEDSVPRGSGSGETVDGSGLIDVEQTLSGDMDRGNSLLTPAGGNEEQKKSGRFSGWSSTEMGRPGKIDIGFGDISKEKRKRGSSLKDIISSVPESPIKGLLNRGAHHLSLKKNKILTNNQGGSGGDGSSLPSSGSSRDVSSSPVGGTPLTNDPSYSRETSPFTRDEGLSRIEGSPVSEVPISPLSPPTEAQANDDRYGHPSQRSPSNERFCLSLDDKYDKHSDLNLTLPSRTAGNKAAPSTEIPPLSMPSLSELLARSGVDPSSLGQGMTDVYMSSRNQLQDVGGVCQSDASFRASSSSTGLPYPLSDPPGYPYIVNAFDPDSESILPVNPLNPIFTVDSAENDRSSEEKNFSSGLGFCPDSPASVRSATSVPEDDRTADVYSSDDSIAARAGSRLSDSGLYADNYFDALETTAMPQHVRVAIVDLNDKVTKEKPVIVNLRSEKPGPSCPNAVSGPNSPGLISMSQKPVEPAVSSPELSMCPIPKAPSVLPLCHSDDTKHLFSPNLQLVPDSLFTKSSTGDEVSRVPTARSASAPAIPVMKTTGGNNSKSLRGAAGEDNIPGDVSADDHNLPSYSWALRNA